MHLLKVELTFAIKSKIFNNVFNNFLVFLLIPVYLFYSVSKKVWDKQTSL